ncbi:hypothetical protein HMPREF1863_01371 [Aedoeadaptatus coxii]|uniref:Uncharacterized protein n=1 Tax=Aedoeadaptatus coxii TaxID=755172 RepID=A0A134AD48_9FIRM|nr:hypothetical protein [Peptoniphilus coxii]KXB65642.1 hypothetical protein HMPREF1863_01371 [Peptoniphilus coxii]
MTNKMIKICSHALKERGLFVLKIIFLDTFKGNGWSGYIPKGVQSEATQGIKIICFDDIAFSHFIGHVPTREF